jgi:hypothetical protein
MRFLGPDNIQVTDRELAIISEWYETLQEEAPTKIIDEDRDVYKSITGMKQRQREAKTLSN